jgi:putative drug exporter of the RND superfamily
MALAPAVVRHRKAITFVWLVAAAALLPHARDVENRLEVSARILDSESGAVEELLAARFASPFARSAILVVSGVPTPDTPPGREVLGQIVSGIWTASGVTRTFSYLDLPDPYFCGQHGSGTFVVVGLRAEGSAVDRLIAPLRERTEALARALRGRHPAINLRWTGEDAINFDLWRTSTDEARAAEARTLPLTLVLLLAAFGTVAAALLTVLAGVLAVSLTFGAAALLSARWPLSILIVNVVSMLGLALGIDYALLTVSRFRESLEAGRDVLEAATDAAGHGGRTVALSGAPVAVASLALLLAPLNELRSTAIGALLVVLVSVLLAATLLPVLLAGLGTWIDAGRIKGGLRLQPNPERYRRWARTVVAHPWLVLAVTVPPLLLLAAQAPRLNARIPRGQWLPPRMESTQAGRDLKEMGRSGVLQSLRVVLELPEDVSALSVEGWAATARLVSAFVADPRVARVQSLRTMAGERADDLAYVSLMPADVKRPFVSEEGDAVLVEVVPRETNDPSTLTTFVRELRGRDPQALTGLAGTRLRTGGLPAFAADYEDAVAGRFARIFAVVVAGTLVTLFLGFRSVLVPVKAVLLNLLSVSAAFGALVLVFQDGFGAKLLGLDGPVDGVFPIVPVLVFSTVFGLSMDYEVFLVARVAEARRAGVDEAEAVAEGLARTGGVITSAALIMIAVFGAFTLGDFVLVKMLGFALAVAVLLDATIIRIGVGPALLRLAGRWNWWPG